MKILIFSLKFIRNESFNPDYNYGAEKRETLLLAADSMGGISVRDEAKGLGGALWDGVSSAATGLGKATQALFGDEAAQQTVKDGAGAMWDYVKVPENWPYLLGAMTPETRESLAQAYESGDAHTVGEIMGAQVANMPIGGGVGNVRKVGKVLDKADDAVRDVAVAENAALAGKQIQFIKGTPSITSTGERFGITFNENPYIFAFGDFKNGQLSTSIRTYVNDSAGNTVRIDGFTGSSAYDQIFNYYGSRVTSVKNSYIADNASAFNASIAQGNTFSQAAMSTWDGQQMLSRGFKNVTVTANPAAGGGYTDIKTLWTK